MSKRWTCEKCFQARLIFNNRDIERHYDTIRCKKLATWELMKEWGCIPLKEIEKQEKKEKQEKAKKQKKEKKKVGRPPKTFVPAVVKKGEKICNHCKHRRKIIEFDRRGKEWNTCNTCSERMKKEYKNGTKKTRQRTQEQIRIYNKLYHLKHKEHLVEKMIYNKHLREHKVLYEFVMLELNN